MIAWGIELLKSSQTARQKVFEDIRRNLDQFDTRTKAEVERKYHQVHSTQTPRPVVDGWLVDRFIDKHAAVNGTCQVVRDHAMVPGAVADFLDTHDLPSRMIMGKSRFLSNFDWPKHWQISRRIAEKTDVVAVTDSLCAIAETGTIMLVSSPDASSTHAFVPENHIVVINAGQVVRHLEDALQLAALQIDSRSSGIHMITGPSKTADVEQTIQYGAHGPRRLHVIISAGQGDDESA